MVSNGATTRRGAILPAGRLQLLSPDTSVPTLVEQSQLVGVGGGDFLMRIIMKQAIDGGFLE